VGTGVALTVGVAVGSTVAVGTTVAVGSTVTAGIDVAVGTTVAVGSAVAIGVAVGSAVTVGSAVAVGVAVGSAVTVGTTANAGVVSKEKHINTLKQNAAALFIFLIPILQTHQFIHTLQSIVLYFTIVFNHTSFCLKFPYCLLLFSILYDLILVSFSQVFISYLQYIFF
jgi:hypothetical protein